CGRRRRLPARPRPRRSPRTGHHRAGSPRRAAERAHRRHSRTWRCGREWSGRADSVKGRRPTLRSPTMQTRTLGRTGRTVSVIGLGTWQLGADWGNVDEADALAVLDAARDAGVTFFD